MYFIVFALISDHVHLIGLIAGCRVSKGGEGEDCGLLVSRIYTSWITVQVSPILVESVHLEHTDLGKRSSEQQDSTRGTENRSDPCKIAAECRTLPPRVGGKLCLPALGFSLGLQESCTLQVFKETVPTIILDQNRSIRSIISQVSNLIEAERSICTGSLSDIV